MRKMIDHLAKWLNSEKTRSTVDQVEAQIEDQIEAQIEAQKCCVPVFSACMGFGYPHLAKKLFPVLNSEIQKKIEEIEDAKGEPPFALTNAPKKWS